MYRTALPYTNGTYMVVVQPTDLDAFEANLSPETVNGVFAWFADDGIHLSLPKWSARASHVFATRAPSTDTFRPAN